MLNESSAFLALLPGYWILDEINATAQTGDRCHHDYVMMSLLIIS